MNDQTLLKQIQDTEPSFQLPRYDVGRNSRNVQDYDDCLYEWEKTALPD